MTKILITGGNGLLGSNLVEVGKKKYDIFSTCRTKKKYQKDMYELEITNKNKVEKLINKIKPDLIIHTAAITNIDWAENYPEETFNVNVIGTKNIFLSSKKIKSNFLFISTDSIFDGKDGWYDEKDIPNPLNVYSKSKLEAEKIISDYEKATILRTSFYGKSNISKKESFPIHILNELKNNRTVNAAIDKINNPIIVSNLVDIIFQIFEKQLTGLFHVSSVDKMSSYEFALNIAKNIKVDKNLINKIYFNELINDKKIVTRPLNSSLNPQKISKFLKLPTMNESIRILCQESKINGAEHVVLEKG